MTGFFSPRYRRGEKIDLDFVKARTAAKRRLRAESLVSLLRLYADFIPYILEECQAERGYAAFREDYPFCIVADYLS